MGAYDQQIKEELESFRPSATSDLSKIQREIYRLYTALNVSLQDNISKTDVLSYMDDIEKSMDGNFVLSTLNKIRGAIQKRHSNEKILFSSTCMASGILEIAMEASRLSYQEIANKAFQTYLQKNEFYGDIWHKRGAQGICLDMGRKVVRLSNFPLSSHNKTEDILDTCTDNLNFCSFLNVYIKHIQKERS